MTAPPPRPPADAQGRVAVAVMAKAPKAGRVKTRLSPPLSPEQAMRMSVAFLGDVTANLALAARQVPVDPFVAFAPAEDAALFDGVLAPGTRLLVADGAEGAAPGVEGFGRALLHAMRALHAQGYAAACVLNADSPTLPTAVLVDLATRLLAPEAAGRAVLGPAEDGGYYALGLAAEQPHVFAGIDWSTGAVAAQTRARAAEAGLAVSELPAWYDVDDRAALARLLDELDGLAAGALAPYAAPRTAACVRSLGLRGLLAA